MNWVAATVSLNTDADTAEAAVEIAADLFYRLGLNGVVINEPPAGGTGKTAASVTGFFPEDDLAGQKRSRLERLADELSDRGMVRCAVTYASVDQEDWADSWKAHFYPQKIGRHIVVKPTWRDYPAEADNLIIEIDPGMAFGTGTHATTRMCLIMLEQHLRKGMRFLDIGTGSGILMIAAFRLGADTVRGVDNDPLAVEIAGANILLNRLPSNRAGVFLSDLAAGVAGSFDLICANILTEVVVELIPDIKRVLAPDGLFICSGLLESKRPLVEEQLARFGFRVVERMTDEEWACLAAIPSSD